MIIWHKYPNYRVSACFWLVFVIGYDAKDALNITASLERWQMDELNDYGKKAWKYLKGEILKNTPHVL